MSRYLMLGRTGDQIVLLPALYHEFLQTGKKPELVVAQEYSTLVEGCSYIEPLVYGGHFSDIAGALEWFGGKTIATQVVGPPKIITAQVYGKSPYKVKANFESFVKDIWNLAGKINLWSEQPPLVFDNRSKEREEELCKLLPEEEGIILVADSGISSPFPYKRLLRELVNKRFPGKVFYLDDVKAHRFYDLLGILEDKRVKALIAIDSAILHLAYGAQIPTCALITDAPSPWHGSAYRPHHITYTRYSKFPRDAVMILDTIENL